MEKLKTLFDLFNEELSIFPSSGAYGYTSIEEFITDDEKSAKFINNLNYGDNTLFDDIIVQEISYGRARHSAISLFLGLVLGKFKNLFGNCAAVLNDDNEDYKLFGEPYINYKLWMLTSINHDYGYHSSYIFKKISIEDLNLKYNLFNDEDNYDYRPLINYSNKYFKVLKNDYKQIIKYYEYSQRYHEKYSHDEKNDHGILGAVLLYDRISKKHYNNVKNHEKSMNYFNDDFGLNDILFYKTACLTIAQHNIYKSNSLEADEFYGADLKHLHHNSKYLIDSKHTLLYLLSLVDTIECVKLFSKSEAKSKYFETLTVLKNVELLVNENEIIIDFSMLYNKIKKDKEELLDKLLDHMSNIKKLETWTSYKITDISETKFKISE